MNSQITKRNNIFTYVLVFVQSFGVSKFCLIQVSDKQKLKQEKNDK